GIAGAIVQGGLIGPMKKWIGEARMVPVGLAVSVLALIAIALSHHVVTGTISLAIFAIGHGLIRPANVSLITQRTQVGQGLAIGVYDSMDALGRVLGPIAGGTLYVMRDSLPFVAAAAVTLLACLFFVTIALPRLRGREETAAP